MLKKQHSLKSNRRGEHGISHVIIPVIVLVLFIAVGGFAYSKVSKSNESKGPMPPNAAEQAARDQAALQAKLAAGGSIDDYKIQCKGTGPVMMTHTPMDAKDVILIEPTGLLAAAHVTPIDHLYFYGQLQSKRDAFPVYAMADGFIVGNELKERSQTLDNGKLAKGALKLIVQHNCQTFSYYDLMTSYAPDIAKKILAGDKHIAIKAGQEIGRVGGQSLDTAIFDVNMRLPGFINPGTYSGEPWKIHVDDFFKYFSGKNKSDMLALNPRKVEPLGGKIDYDIAGKLRGNWFQVGTNGYAGPTNLARTNNIGDDGYFSGHLSIAPDAVNINKTNISFGDYQGKPTQFSAPASSPNPANVSESSGVVKYELNPYKQPVLNPQAPDNTVKGTVLFQLTDGGKKLKMEAFPGKTATQVSAFTSAVKTYER